MTMDRETLEVYERRADEWHTRRRPQTNAAAEFGHAVAARGIGGPVADLGCGPGWHTAAIGAPAIALDAVEAMLDLVPAYAPDAWRIRADLARLPFRRHALGAAWASKSYVHLARAMVPLALHDLHRALAVGALAELLFFGGDTEYGPYEHDDFPGRLFSTWPGALLRDVLVGAGFAVDHFDESVTAEGSQHIIARVTRARTLADTVGPDMRLLLCGLNPSVYAADAGAGFARPGNRFWPAALEAAVVTTARDPVHALKVDRVGMTDLVKRASPRADDLTRAEYRDGLARIDRLAAWLQPGAICFIGLAGWRAATERKAVAGPQTRTIGGRPVYVMPNTSGVNAGSTPADLADHLRAAAALADAGGARKSR